MSSSVLASRAAGLSQRAGAPATKVLILGRFSDSPPLPERLAASYLLLGGGSPMGVRVDGPGTREGEPDSGGSSRTHLDRVDDTPRGGWLVAVRQLRTVAQTPGLSRMSRLDRDDWEPTWPLRLGVRWPAFAQAGVDAGVRAVFAFPLALGAIRLGVMVFCRDRAGALTAEELASGLVLADVATHVVLGLQARAPADTLHAPLANEPHWAEVHQATAMLSVQLGVSLDQAFVRVRAHAFANGSPLGNLARAVVAGRAHLEDSPEPRG